MAPKATTGQLSANARRAEARITSGRAYTKASIKRLVSEGVNVGQLLSESPGGGLPGAQAGADAEKRQQLYMAQHAEQIAALHRQIQKQALKHVMQIVKQHGKRPRKREPVIASYGD